MPKQDNKTKSESVRPAAQRGLLSAKTIRTKAVRCLYGMMLDEALKPSDRLNAIKAALEYSGKLLESSQAPSDDALHVVFDNIPADFSE